MNKMNKGKYDFLFSLFIERLMSDSDNMKLWSEILHITGVKFMQFNLTIYKFSICYFVKRFNS